MKAENFLINEIDNRSLLLCIDTKAPLASIKSAMLIGVAIAQELETINLIADSYCCDFAEALRIARHVPTEEEKLAARENREEFLKEIAQYFGNEQRTRIKVTNPQQDALNVIALSPQIRKFLKENDPKALEQAEKALNMRRGIYRNKNTGLTVRFGADESSPEGYYKVNSETYEWESTTPYAFIGEIENNREWEFVK